MSVNLSTERRTRCWGPSRAGLCGLLYVIAVTTLPLPTAVAQLASRLRPVLEDHAGQVAGAPTLALRSAPPDADDPDREDGGPRADATLVWAPGDDPGPVPDRLAALARATLGRE